MQTPVFCLVLWLCSDSFSFFFTMCHKSKGHPVYELDSVLAFGLQKQLHFISMKRCSKYVCNLCLDVALIIEQG